VVFEEFYDNRKDHTEGKTLRAIRSSRQRSVNTAASFEPVGKKHCRRVLKIPPSYQEEMTHGITNRRNPAECR
jgi:hypothetical protein